MLHTVRKLLSIFGATIVLLAGIVLARATLFESHEQAVVREPAVGVPAGAAERLAGSLRFPTVSHADPGALDAQAFGALHGYLQRSFPNVHAQLQRETVRAHSILYTWRGTDPSLAPILLAGHQDVVPVEPGTEEKWQSRRLAAGSPPDSSGAGVLSTTSPRS